MNCPYCGTEVEDGEEICPNCEGAIGFLWDCAGLELFGFCG